MAAPMETKTAKCPHIAGMRRPAATTGTGARRSLSTRARRPSSRRSTSREFTLTALSRKWPQPGSARRFSRWQGSTTSAYVQSLLHRDIQGARAGQKNNAKIRSILNNRRVQISTKPSYRCIYFLLLFYLSPFPSLPLFLISISLRLLRIPLLYPPNPLRFPVQCHLSPPKDFYL